MNKPLRYILVGTGGFGRRWCMAFLPRLAKMGKAVAVAAADIVPEHLENAKEHLGLPDEKCYSDFETAIAENDADFVINVTPPSVHERVIDAALARDMHILSEKPIADTIEASCRIYKKVTEAGKKMAVTMLHRFDQDKQTLERAIHSGDYGRLGYLVGRFAMDCRKYASWGAFRYEMDDPLLIEGAVHQFDIIRALTRSNCKTVYATTWNPPWSEFKGDCQALVQMTMENGVKCVWEGAKANASNLNRWSNDYFRAECESATLELDRRRVRRITNNAEGKPQFEDLPLLQQEVWINSWLAEMYCDWLLGDREDHPASLQDNIHCAALTFAAIESAHTGQPIDVAEFLKKNLETVRVR